jgi:hypothetical protein
LRWQREIVMPQAVGVARTRAGSALPQVAGMVGNVLEWYDFAAYGFLAATFAGNFFPLESHLLSLMASFGVFAVAFVTRPLGACCSAISAIASAGERP